VEVTAALPGARKTDWPGKATSGLRQKSNSIQQTGKCTPSAAREMLPIGSTHLDTPEGQTALKKTPSIAWNILY